MDYHNVADEKVMMYDCTMKRMGDLKVGDVLMGSNSKESRILSIDLVNEEASHLAERIANTAGSDSRTRITRAFETVLNRPPSNDELNKFADTGYSLVSVCRVLLNSNEYLYVD